MTDAELAHRVRDYIEALQKEGVRRVEALQLAASFQSTLLIIDSDPERKMPWEVGVK